MHDRHMARWQHAHTFGQDIRRPGESKTLIVIAITGMMMVVEIVAGMVYGSMALLADGLHMASHAAALTINAVAYVYARRHADDRRFSFGTGKVNTLGGYTGAVLLAGFALAMAAESFARLAAPVPIVFNQAIFVAVLGLLVNGASVFILEHRADARGEDPHSPEHGHDEPHEHAHEQVHEGGRAHHHGHDRHHGHDHAHDHNLVSAYLHVLADALTSLLAIVALLCAKYFGLIWMDPVMGIVGAILVARWSVGLLRSTSAILLDRTAPDSVSETVRASIESVHDNRVADLHVWSVGPGIYSAIVSVVTHHPQEPGFYKDLIPLGTGIVHVCVEVHECE